MTIKVNRSIWIDCPICSRNFYLIKYRQDTATPGTVFCCSTKCRKKLNTEEGKGPIESICERCGKRYFARRWVVQKGYGKFCSPYCRYNKSQTLSERFWGYVEKTDSCWLWRGGLTGDGYGSFSLGDGCFEGAHRFAYQEYIGDALDPNIHLHHTCPNTNCVYFGHLEEKTPAEHIRLHMPARWAKGYKFRDK